MGTTQRMPTSVQMTSPSGEVATVTTYTYGDGLPRVPRVYFDGAAWQPISDIAQWEQIFDAEHGGKIWRLVTKKSWRRKARETAIAVAAVEAARREPEPEQGVAGGVEPLALPQHANGATIEILDRLDRLDDRLHLLGDFLFHLNTKTDELLKLWKDSGL